MKQKLLLLVALLCSAFRPLSSSAAEVVGERLPIIDGQSAVFFAHLYNKGGQAYLYETTSGTLAFNKAVPNKKWRIDYNAENKTVTLSYGEKSIYMYYDSNYDPYNLFSNPEDAVNYGGSGTQGDCNLHATYTQKDANNGYDYIFYIWHASNQIGLLLEKDYEGFEIDSEFLFNTIVNSEISLARKRIKKLDETVDDSEWNMTPQTVNAYYYPMDNSINFPAAIFQLPFFSANQPDYLNYGAIGSIAGHELTHAFDSSGSLFDANGVLNNWWTNSTYYEFDNLSKCFIDQYNQYKLIGSEGKEFNLNGKLTLNENLADNGGLSRSFEAWKLSSIKDPKKFSERNKALPGLSDFTPEQLFYIAFGQSFCEKNTPELLEMLNETDPHSPGQYRIIGSVSNNEHFAKTFNCPKNSPMNPEKKCLIW